MEIEQNPLPVPVKAKKERLSKSITAAQFLQLKFNELDFDGLFKECFGSPEDNFSMIIYGASGNGKTEGEVMFCKYMSRFGSVYFNSNEQGISLSLQLSWRRNNMQECDNVRLVHKDSFDKMTTRLKRKKSAKIVFIDSIQHTKMTFEMWKQLRAMFPKKIFILISHSDGRRPQGAAAKEIEYDVDIKVYVKDFVMYTSSGRFGGGKPFMIYEKGYRDKMAEKTGKRSKQIRLPI